MASTMAVPALPAIAAGGAPAWARRRSPRPARPAAARAPRCEAIRRSASIRAAVASSGGQQLAADRLGRSSRLAWAERLTAATTRPSRSRIGAATERRPSSSSWSTSAQPCARTRSSSARSASAERHRARRQRPSSHARQVGVERLVGQAGEQDAAHRGRVGREARADVDRHGHDPRDGHARDVDDVVAVEHRHRARTRGPRRRGARGAARRPRAATGSTGSA